MLIHKADIAAMVHIDRDNNHVPGLLCAGDDDRYCN